MRAVYEPGGLVPPSRQEGPGRDRASRGRAGASGAWYSRDRGLGAREVHEDQLELLDPARLIAKDLGELPGGRLPGRVELDYVEVLR